MSTSEAGEMPMISGEVLSGIALVISALLGGGGIVALVRARGEHRQAEQTALTQHQQFTAKALAEQEKQFRDMLIEQTNRLQEQLKDVDARNDKMSEQYASTMHTVGRLEATVAAGADRINDLVLNVTRTHEQNTALIERMKNLDDERAGMVQSLQVSFSTRELLQKENEQLRAEIARVKGQLPPRVETGAVA